MASRRWARTRRSQLPTHKVLYPQGRENKTRLSGTNPLLPWKQDGKGDLRLEQGSDSEWGLHDFGLGSGFQHVAPLKRNAQDHPCITMDASTRAESQAQTGNHHSVNASKDQTTSVPMSCSHLQACLYLQVKWKLGRLPGKGKTRLAGEVLNSE